MVTRVPAIFLKAVSGKRTPPKKLVLDLISCKTLSVLLSIVPIDEIIDTCPPSLTKSSECLTK